MTAVIGAAMAHSPVARRQRSRHTPPTMATRTILLTGGTKGIGRAMATQLARTGARLILAGRSPEAGAAAVAELRQVQGAGELEFRPVDLSIQRSVREFAAQVLRDVPRLDVLVNNAGIQSYDRRLSVDGIELVFATNVLGPWLLTELLRPRLLANAPARIVVTASTFAGGLDLDDLQFERRPYSDTASYKQSKQANRMLSWALARRLRGQPLTVNAFAPGFVLTSLYRESPASTQRTLKWVNFFFGKPAEKGADTGAWLATSPELEGVSGKFFEKRREKKCAFRNEAEEERLWAACARLAPP